MASERLNGAIQGGKVARKICASIAAAALTAYFPIRPARDYPEEQQWEERQEAPVAGQGQALKPSRLLRHRVRSDRTLPVRASPQEKQRPSWKSTSGQASSKGTAHAVETCNPPDIYGIPAWKLGARGVKMTRTGNLSSKKNSDRLNQPGWGCQVSEQLFSPEHDRLGKQLRF